jgi:hypothetical protein
MQILRVLISISSQACECSYVFLKKVSIGATILDRVLVASASLGFLHAIISVLIDSL